MNRTENFQDMQAGRNHGSQTSAELLQELGPLSPNLEVQTGALSFTDETVSILSTNSLLARSLFGHAALKRKDASSLRRKREFIPNEKKDEGYWDKRRKNNEAAKRSREKRRVNDMVLEKRILALLEENARLKAELLAIKFRFGLIKDPAETTVLPAQPSRCHPEAAGPPSMPPHPSQPGFLPRANGPYVVTEGHSHPYLQGSGHRSMNRDTPCFSEDSGFSTPGSSSVGSPVFFDERLGDQETLMRAEDHSFQGHRCPGSSDTEAEPVASAVTGRHYPGQVPRTGRLDLGEGIKCLPHKLRFKSASGPELEFATLEATQNQGSPIHTSVPREPMREQLREQPRPFHQPHSQSEVVGVVQPIWRNQAGKDPKQGPPCRMPEDPQYCGQQGAYPSASPADPSYHAENTALKSQLTSLSEEVAQLKRLFSQQLFTKTN
ncbi:NFIL3 protein, partial [Polyodon spathula]|nr:nuclear factor, interleukin 3 regulated, member 6 [Polyodon spathula]MBN3282989.1 NFIL3 protein [Polyodon spathula]